MNVPHAFVSPEAASGLDFRRRCNWILTGFQDAPIRSVTLAPLGTMSRCMMQGDSSEKFPAKREYIFCPKYFVDGSVVEEVNQVSKYFRSVIPAANPVPPKPAALAAAVLRRLLDAHLAAVPAAPASAVAYAPRLRGGPYLLMLIFGERRIFTTHTN